MGTPAQVDNGGASVTGPRAAVVLVAALVLVHVAFAPFALTHLDFARDVAVALGIVQGEALPMEGPVLASTLHLGPIWNYALAAVLLVARSWLAVCIAVAAGEAAKFALAYRLGTRVWNRDAGVLFAAGLALPGWTFYAQALPTHPALAETLGLAFLLCLWRYAERGATRWLIGAAAAYALVLHAHPTAFPLGLLAIPVAVARARSGTLRSRELLLAALVFIVWFAPALYEQWRVGLGDFKASRAYLASASTTGRLADMGAVLLGWFATGPRVVASDVLNWGPASGVALACLLTGWMALGIVCAIFGAPQRTRLIAAMVLAVAVTGFAAVVAIRAITPYYFLFALWPLIAGVAALGLAVRIRARAALICVVIGAAVLAAVVNVRAASTISSGRFRLALLPLFDIKQPFQPGTPTPMMPAYGMRALGERYCSAGTVTVHGALAFLALHDYVVEAALQCPAVNVTLAGAGATSLVALTRPLLREAGATPVDVIGPLGLLVPARPVFPAQGYTLPPDRPYPPVSPAFGALHDIALDITLDPGEAIVASNAFFAFTMQPSFAATMNGMPMPPLARDNVSTIFGCSVCGDGTQHWRLTIRSPALERVDVVVIQRR